MPISTLLKWEGLQSDTKWFFKPVLAWQREARRREGSVKHLLRRFYLGVHLRSMWDSFISKCTIVYYTILYYTFMHCAILSCAIPYYTYTTLHYSTTPHWTTLHHTTPDYATLHCTTLHYTTLHYTILHYTALHSTTTTMPSMIFWYYNCQVRLGPSRS